MNDAKEKLSKADSSSSDSEDEATPKRKKPINHIDKPTEEVRYFSNLQFLKWFTISVFFLILF